MLKNLWGGKRTQAVISWRENKQIPPSGGEKVSQISTLTLENSSIPHYICSSWLSRTWEYDGKAVAPQVRLWIQFWASVNYGTSSFQADLKSWLGNLNVNRGLKVASFWCCREGCTGTSLSGEWVSITGEWWIYEVSSSSKTQVTLNSSKQVRNDQVSTAEVGWYFVIREAIPGTGSSESKTNQGRLWLRPALRSWWAHADVTRPGLSRECSAARRGLPQTPRPQQQRATSATGCTLQTGTLFNKKYCKCSSKDLAGPKISEQFSLSCKRLSQEWACCAASILNVQFP